MLLSLVVLAGALAAQDVAIHVQRLAAPEAEQREDARRRLVLTARAHLPVEALLACVAGGGDAAAGAADVLAAHADLHVALRRLVLPHTPAAVVDAALPALEIEHLWQVVLAARASSPRLAEGALLELARRGALLGSGPGARSGARSEALAEALPGDHGNRALAQVLAAEDAPGPSALAADLVAHDPAFAEAAAVAITGETAALHRVLRALADYPRDHLVPWLARWTEVPVLSEKGTASAPIDPVATLLAIAALPPHHQSPAHARLVLRLLGAPAPAFLPDLAAARFSARIADGLVAAAHGSLLAGQKVADLLPLLTNVSEAGESHLLGLALTLPPDEREEVCRWLDSRAVPELGRRVGAALDGDGPLEDCWLQRAGPHLRDPRRIARVVAELKAPPPRSFLAFTALVEADHFDPGLLRVAAEEPRSEVLRTRELLRLSRGVLPLATARGFLAHFDPSVRLSAVHYLAVPDLDEATQTALVALQAGDPDDRVRAACARALAVFGADARAEVALALALGSAYGGEAIDWLIERPRPNGLALLRAERARRSGARDLDEIDTGRVRLGDLGPLPGLLDRIGELPPRLVKRLVPAMRASEDAAVLAKARAAVRNHALADQVREPVAEALALHARPDAAFLQQVYEHEDDDGVRLAALRGLLRTPAGAAFLADLEAALGRRPLRGSDEDVACEVLGAAALPLAPALVEFAARLVLVAPLANPVAEAALCLSEHGESADYPLVQPLVELIRRDPRREHGEVIARVVAQARAHRSAHALSQRRLGHLLGGLALAEPAFAAAAPALARAIVEAPDRDSPWLGPAWSVLARAAESEGDLAAAAAAYERAHRGYLAYRWSGVMRRRFLADPCPARGEVPLGALAGRPDLLRAKIALTRGDRAGARALLASARLRASADRATLAEIDTLTAQVAGK